ncbi:MAG: hypothetical protein ACJ8C4_15685 [Gemmataceae bacterium]
MTAKAIELVLLANVASTLFMTGLIWFVQIVHYPLFAQSGRDQFAAYHSAHSAATTRLVAVPMLIEMITAIILAIAPPAPGVIAASWAGLGLIVLIWLSTAALQIPNHTRLSTGFDARTHRSLVRGNWIRSIGWSVRTALMLTVLWKTMVRA